MKQLNKVGVKFFNKLKGAKKKTGQEILCSEMIGDISIIQTHKYYRERKRLYYIVSVNSVYMRNQEFIQNVPELEEYNYKKKIQNKSAKQLDASQYQVQSQYQMSSQQQVSFENDKSGTSQTLDQKNQKQQLVQVKLPTDLVLVIWNIIIMFLIFSQMLLIPLVISFSIANFGLYIYDWIVNCFFYIDIILQFNTAIYLNGNLIKDRIIIIKEYLKFWFWIDIVSSFPFDEIFDSPDLQNQAQVIKLLRFLKFIKVIRLLRALKLKKIFGKIEEYVIVIESLFQFTQMIKLIILILCIVHWCACIWNLFIDDSQDNWAAKYDIQDSDWSVQYITALYFCMTTMITVGYGDVHAYTYEEMIYAIFLMLLASAVFGYTTNIVMELFTNQFDKLEQCEQNIKKYLKAKKIDVELTSRVTNYIEWLKISLAKAQEHESTVMDSLSANLKSQVVCLINSKIIQQISFFEQQQFSKDLLSNVAYQLQEKVFGPEEHIFYENSQGDEMYYIVNGTILVKNRTTIIQKLDRQNIFGEICLFSDKPRSATILTEDYVNLLFLKKEPFLMIVSQLRSDWEKYHQMKYYLEIENDYSVLNIQCYICRDYHLANQCPKTHYIVDLSQYYIHHQKDNTINRKTFKHKHAYQYIRDQKHLKALKLLHQKLMKLYLLGRQVLFDKNHFNKIENQIIESQDIEIDQVKQYDYYVTKGNVEEMIIGINLNAQIRTKSMAEEKEYKLLRKKQEMRESMKLKFSKVVNSIGFLKNASYPQIKLEEEQIQNPQSIKKRLNQNRILREQARLKLQQIKQQQQQNQYSKYSFYEESPSLLINQEDIIQDLKVIQMNKGNKTRKLNNSTEKRKTRKITQQERSLILLLRQIDSENRISLSLI